MQAEVRPASREGVGRAARGAILLTAALGFNALGNLLFHVFIARGGGVQNYGAVGALLTFGTIGTTLAAGVQYAVARGASISSASAGRLLRAGYRAALPMLLLVAVLALGAWPLAAYLRLDGPLPVLLADAYFAAIVVFSVPAGILIGQNRLGAYAAVSATGTVLRMAYGVLFGWGAAEGVGALGSSLLTFVSISAIALLVLRIWPAKRRLDLPSALPSMVREGTLGAVLSALLWGAWSLPLLFSRHFLAPTEAGDLASVHLAVSSILLLTAALATATFPLLARGRRGGAAAGSVLATGAISLACAAAAALVGPTLIHKVYGAGFTAPTVLFLALGASVTVVAMVTNGLWAAQALQRSVAPVSWVILLAIGGEVVLGLAWHPDAVAIAAGPGLATATAGAVVGAWIGVLKFLRGRRDEAAALRQALALHSADASREGAQMLPHTVVGMMVHNEATMIEHSLGAVLSERAGGHGVARVVVVASACSDGTEDIVRRLAARDPRVTLLVEPVRSGKASAINWFLRETTEPVCLLIGGDTLPAPGALAELVAPLADPAVGMTGARVVPSNERKGVGRLVHWLWEMHHEVALRHPKLGEAVAFQRVFERLDTGLLADEVNIEHLITSAGLELRYAGRAVVFNRGAGTLGDYLAHRRRNHGLHLKVAVATGYHAATMRGANIGPAALRNLLRNPHRLPVATAAIALEVAARAQARYYFRQGMEAGIWRPIASAKRAFQVDFETLGDERTGREEVA